MKTYSSMAVTVLTVLLLSRDLLVTHAATPSSSTSQTLNMNMIGGVVSAGNQNYLIVQKGPALEAVIDGYPLVSSRLTYTLNAQQKGLSTSGSATFQLTGKNATGASVTVSGNVQIWVAFQERFCHSDALQTVPAEVPAAFTGGASVQSRLDRASIVLRQR